MGRILFAKIYPQLLEYKDPFSGLQKRKTRKNLRSSYMRARQALLGMYQGSEFPELAADDFSDWLGKNFKDFYIEEFPDSQAELDVELLERRRTAFALQGIHDPMELPAERELLESLRKARTARRVRRVVMQSEWLSLDGRDGIGAFLYTYPEKFLSIKIDARVPKPRGPVNTPWIDSISRRIAALRTGYKPSTGDRYLSELLFCRKCHRNLAVVGFKRGEKVMPWCGLC